jgi:branched-chain amino acid transport system permease protein
MVELIAQFAVNGLIVGLNYSLTAIGLTMIFGIMNIANFAHGQFYMLGGFFAYFLAQALGLNYFLALAVAVVAVACIGWVFERLVFTRLRRATLLSSVLATIGIGILLEALAHVVWGPQPENIPSPFSPIALEIGPVYLTESRIFAFFTTIATLVALQLFLARTRFGTAMRAAFQQQEAALLVGIDVDRLHAFTFALGAGLAALGGALLGTLFSVYPTMGDLATLKAFIVVILGGLGSIAGATIGGLILGVAEGLGTMVASAWKDAVGFLLVILILLYKPDGLFKR